MAVTTIAVTAATTSAIIASNNAAKAVAKKTAMCKDFVIGYVHNPETARMYADCVDLLQPVQDTGHLMTMKLIVGILLFSFFSGVIYSLIRRGTHYMHENWSDHILNGILGILLAMGIITLFAGVMFVIS